jgi:hypothetical protein
MKKSMMGDWIVTQEGNKIVVEHQDCAGAVIVGTKGSKVRGDKKLVVKKERD